MQIGNKKFKKVGEFYYEIGVNGKFVDVYTSEVIKFFIWWFNVKQNFNLKTIDDE